MEQEVRGLIVGLFSPLIHTYRIRPENMNLLEELERNQPGTGQEPNRGPVRSQR